MFKASVKSTFDAKKTGERLKAQAGLAQEWLTGRVVKDTGPFVPRDTGELERSAVTATDYKNGIIVYAQKYARRLYYGVSFNFSRDKNSKATHRWFEYAKATWLKTWIDGVRKIMGGK